MVDNPLVMESQTTDVSSWMNSAYLAIFTRRVVHGYITKNLVGSMSTPFRPGDFGFGIRMKKLVVDNEPILSLRI